MKQKQERNVSYEISWSVSNFFDLRKRPIFIDIYRDCVKLRIHRAVTFGRNKWETAEAFLWSIDELWRCLVQH